MEDKQAICDEISIFRNMGDFTLAVGPFVQFDYDLHAILMVGVYCIGIRYAQII
jgi:hypothetical protein